MWEKGTVDFSSHVQQKCNQVIPHRYNSPVRHQVEDVDLLRFKGTVDSLLTHTARFEPESMGY